MAWVVKILLRIVSTRRLIDPIEVLYCDDGGQDEANWRSRVSLRIDRMAVMRRDIIWIRGRRRGSRSRFSGPQSCSY